MQRESRGCVETISGRRGETQGKEKKNKGVGEGANSLNGPKRGVKAAVARAVVLV